MAVINGEEMENQGIRAGAAMLALAMRAAPKTRGVDALKTALVLGPDLETLASAMEEFACTFSGFQGMG